mgnify:CR=1 FL=1|jgi:hypothetical protein
MEVTTPTEQTDIIRALAELPDTAIVSEKAIARIFDRHIDSVRRAVQRDELPEPVRLFGQPSWTVRMLVQHLEARLEKASQEAKRGRLTVAQHRP